MTSKKSTSSSATHEAVLSFDYADPQRAARVECALEPEVRAIPGDRSHATVERTGESLSVRVRATDLVALRAGINTWTTLVTVAERVDERTD